MASPRKALPASPSERAAEMAKRAGEAQAKAEQTRRILQSAADKVASTPDGKVLLKYIARHLCGRNKIKSALRYERTADGQNILVGVNPEATIHHAARESVWLELRELFSKSNVHELENL